MANAVNAQAVEENTDLRVDYTPNGWKLFDKAGDVKNAAKAVLAGCGWERVARGGKCTYPQLEQRAKQVKTWCGFMEIPSKVNSFIEHLTGFDVHQWQSYVEVLGDVTDIESSLDDGVNVLSAEVSAGTKKALELVGGPGLTIGMGCQIALSGDKILKLRANEARAQGLQQSAGTDEGRRKYSSFSKALDAQLKHEWIKIAQFTSLFALGVFLIYTAWAQAAIAGTVLLCFSTSALTWSYLSRFFEEFCVKPARADIGALNLRAFAQEGFGKPLVPLAWRKRHFLSFF